MSLPPYPQPPRRKPTEPPSEFFGEPITPRLSDFVPPPVVEPPPVPAPTLAPGDAITIDTGNGGTIEATVTAVTPGAGVPESGTSDLA